MEISKKCESKPMVSAKEFFSKWKECAKIQPEIDYYYHKPQIKPNFKIKSYHKTPFTNIVIDNDDSLVLEVAKKIGLKCYNGDYFYIDSVFYKAETDEIKSYSGNSIGTWLKTIRIAFEHEFDDVRYKLFTEIARLLTTNCELRVLVSYGHYPSLKKEFEYFLKIISGCRDSQKISDDESFLFILGHKLIEDPNLTWQGFIYKKENIDEWKEI